MWYSLYLCIYRRRLIIFIVENWPEFKPFSSRICFACSRHIFERILNRLLLYFSQDTPRCIAFARWRFPGHTELCLGALWLFYQMYWRCLNVHGMFMTQVISYMFIPNNLTKVKSQQLSKWIWYIIIYHYFCFAILTTMMHRSCRRTAFPQNCTKAETVCK